MITKPTVVLPFRLPPAAPDECIMCRESLGQGLLSVRRACAPWDMYCLPCAQWMDGPLNVEGCHD